MKRMQKTLSGVFPLYFAVCGQIQISAELSSTPYEISEQVIPFVFLIRSSYFLNGAGKNFLCKWPADQNWMGSQVVITNGHS